MQRIPINIAFDRDINRRDFLKTIGMGLLGAGFL